MGKPQWEALVEQLQEADPNVRRKACRRLAAIGDPQAIPFLRNAYLQEDDERVRQAAHDALAAFKAMEMGEGGRSELFSRRTLVGLTILLAVSLVLNILVALASSNKTSSPHTTNNTVPTARDTLISQLTEQLRQAKEDAANLQAEIGQHNNTGEVVCTATYHRPPQFALSPLDTQTYRDVTLVADNLNLALFQLQQPQAIWDRICTQKIASMTDGLEALKQLDQIDIQLQKVDDLLQKAIREPAATFGPTVTPTPTITNTPLPSQTPVPVQPTSPSATQSPATQPPAETVQPTSAPTVTPVSTNTPEPTPILEATLPYPDLDYDAITRDLYDRFVVMSDLKNSYNTGMIDYWQRAQNGEQLSSTICVLAAWPNLFAWTNAQLAQLQRTDAADPQLEEAVTLVNDGLTLAYQARALYESSCSNLALISTADEGITTAQQALDKLTQAQSMVDAIRSRP
jgi:hypothetical protein